MAGTAARRALIAASVVIALLMPGCWVWRSLDHRETTGPQKTVVIMANYGEERPRARRPRGFEWRARWASEWIETASGGQAWLESLDDPSKPATIIGPIELRDVTRDCDNSGWLELQAARLLAHKEVRRQLNGREGDIDRLLLVLGGFGCTSAAGKSFATRNILANGALHRMSVAYLKPTSRQGAMTHELLHGFGIGHAVGWSCRDPSNVDTCVAASGGHPMSLMGSGRFQSQLDVVHMESLGWVSCEILKPGDGPKTLYALEDFSVDGPRCFKIPVEGGHLYMEHRSFQGLDAVGYYRWEANPTVYLGAMIYYQSDDPDTPQRTSRLLSMDQLLGLEGCHRRQKFKDCRAQRSALTQGLTYTHPDGTRITMIEHSAYESLIEVR